MINENQSKRILRAIEQFQINQGVTKPTKRKDFQSDSGPIPVCHVIVHLEPQLLFRSIMLGVLILSRPIVL